MGEKWVEEEGEATVVAPSSFYVAALPEGSNEFCSCGLPWQHNLIGTPCNDARAFIRKVDELTMTEQPSTAHIDRKDVRAYHRKIQDFLLQAINGGECTYRQARNTIILYPPDGSQNITVYARNSERQLRSLTQWYEKHVAPKPTIELVPQPDVTPADIHVHPIDVTSESESDLGDLMEGEWSQHFSEEGEPVEGIETNGMLWRCTPCMGTESEWISNRPAGIGGHRRMRHTDTSDLFTPEALAKSVDSRRFNRLSRQIEEAVAVLAKSIGMQVGPSDRIAELEAEVETLRKQNGELEARLALIREAYGA